MKKIFILLIFLISTDLAYAVSKKDSINQNKALLDEQTMFDAGTWTLYMEKCAGKTLKKFMDDLARLSWPDFINYKKGMARYASGYQTAGCGNKDTENGKGFYNWIIAQLENKTRHLNNNEIENNIKETESKISEIDENEDIETKLEKLKTLYEKKLISKEEYDEKKSELLDNF